jgi:hypothetical protein
LATSPKGAVDRALPLPGDVESPPSPDASSTRFRYDWLRRQPGVIGYAVKPPADAWVVAGEASETWAEQAVFLTTIAEQLGAELGFTDCRRIEVRGPKHGAVVMSAPDGALLALRLDAQADVAQLTRAIGGAP